MTAAAVDIPFHVATRLMGMCFRLEVSNRMRRAQGSASACRRRILKTCCCLTICSASLIPASPLPVVHPAARTRRLTSLFDAAAVARTSPAIFVIDDAHWIDQISEEMFANTAIWRQ
jgi:adenylate cyclase